MTKGLMAAALCAMTIFCPLQAEEGARRPANSGDIVAVDALRDPALSPDGRQALIVRSTLPAGADTRESTLWLLHLEPHTPPRQLSSAAGARKPCWSPDGSRIAYL